MIYKVGQNMAYKPFKLNKGYYDDTSKAKDTKKDPKYEIVRMKLFGFRSGVAWKMIPALFYYLFSAIFLISSIMGEFREFTFEETDYVLCVLKYVFLFIVAFGPAIFLSDFAYRDKLPLFKNRTISGNVLGMTIVYILSIFLIWTYQYCMSDTYTASADAYYAEQESKQKELEEAQMESTTENTEDMTESEID